MTQTVTRTATYTIADVKNVLEQVIGNLAMIVRSTGLWTDGHLIEIMSDLSTFAEAGFLTRIDIVLLSGTAVVRAHRYDVSYSASSWQNAPPSGNIWPRIAGASLHVVVAWHSTWLALPDAQKDAFRRRLHQRWGPASIDTSYAGLSHGETVRYASRAYGVERRTYVRTS